MGNIIAIDAGATNLRIALIDGKGKILSRLSSVTDGPNLLRQLYEGIDAHDAFEGIAVAFAGPISRKTGAILKSPNLGIQGLNLVGLLEKKYGKKAILMNDCVAAVLAEKYYGAGKDCDNLAYVTISTGIGCGVIIDGKVLLGKDGNAHEVGHMVIDQDSLLRCGCGSYGHWEAYCSGKNMPRYVEHLIKTEYAGEPSALSIGRKKAPAEHLFAVKGDRVASEIIGKIGMINATGFANIINVYDPELITVGGSVALKNKRILEDIKRNVHKYAINRMPEIRLTSLGDDICLYGAAAGFRYFG